MTNKWRGFAAVAFIIGMVALFMAGGNSSSQGSSDPRGVTVIGASPSASGTPHTLPSNPVTTVVAPPSSRGTGSAQDACGVLATAGTTEIVFFHGTNALHLCSLEESNGWISFSGTSTGTRSELCGMTDGTAAGEDLIDVFDSGDYLDGIDTCRAFQTAGWGASAFWPVLNGLTPAPQGPGLPPDYFG